ncbi:Uncharacterised protein [Serratia fonticola]|uniref:Uncharacterized protein n=1 Tax=Serratia fonticola TaxID=47917 RepID=A0A3S5AZI3_SERFO|nr:hypothetical protein [Serratia fonticola]CAI1820709.1 Uncharacterised protein [Serratia fonticola]VEI69445.1 Uncharacterised protein [Serratia fonticola]
MKSPFMHFAVSTEEATRLIECYRRTGAKAEKTLNVDPRLWDVTVQLPEVRFLQPTPRALVNRMWR